jgi:hypothetical protein
MATEYDWHRDPLQPIYFPPQAEVPVPPPGKFGG